MHFLFFDFRHRKFSVLFLWMMVPLAVFPEIKTWSGSGGNGLWSDPLNWNSGHLPDSTDDVLLDNGDVPGSYQVVLPDQAVTIRTLTITPGDGNNIELILPSSNRETNAFRVRGPGYGIWLNAGGIFRNASGLAGGESLQIADSMRISNGGEYIHNTRTAHANSILKLLSSSPGTEKGLFVFDVPKASYTISVSNRTYGSLVLSAAAYGQSVNYTCSGSSPLRIGGDLRILDSVRLSVNMSGLNGNIQVQGDYIQEGGIVNLASGTGNSTFLRIKGDFFQSPGASVTTTSLAEPGIEMNGSRLQLIKAEGVLLNGLNFRVNNPSGCRLMSALYLPHSLELLQGRVISTDSNLLSLGDSCQIRADSSLVNGAYVDGPLRKEGLNNEPYFLFPVGKAGNLRWLELKQGTGNFKVEYFGESAASVGTALGTGIDHVSKMEYWTVKADASTTARAEVELSFASPQSGGVTDPAFLHVSAYSADKWSDEGHTGITGGIGSGSVISNPITDFTPEAFTLASTVNLENPLPITQIQFEGKENKGYAFFSWSFESPVKADHFDLLESAGQVFHLLARIPAKQDQLQYTWLQEQPLKAGAQWYKLNMVDRDGHVYPAKTVLINRTENQDLTLYWVPSFLSSGRNEIHFRAAVAMRLEYRIVSMAGQPVKQGSLFIPEGNAGKILSVEALSPGIYQFYGTDQQGRIYRLRCML
ncbi:MAG TPA: hypothetical protein VFC34_02910 [Puia sp.]|nr:hypothetical protein [Puia sp.]